MYAIIEICTCQNLNYIFCTEFSVCYHLYFGDKIIYRYSTHTAMRNKTESTSIVYIFKYTNINIRIK